MINFLWKSSIILFFLMFLFSCSLINTNQAKLANELGIDDYKIYPPAVNFPYGYFKAVLIQGMSRKEAYSYLRGYELVYSCGKESEIYYFYSVDEQDAVRIGILFDNYGRFKKVVPEDKDSLTFDTTSCSLGRNDQ